MGLKIANKQDQPGKFQISEVMSPLQAVWRASITASVLYRIRTVWIYFSGLCSILTSNKQSV